jgi:hypothetical protein
VKKLRYTTLVCIVLPLGALVGVSPALAASDKCHAISAKGLGSATGPTTTTARITGGGFLNGTTSGQFDQPVGNFSGTVTFATSGHDTLVVPVSGNLDPVALTFNAVGGIASGTGKLQGSSGSLAFAGRITDPLAGTFTESVTGEVCLAK